MSRESAYSVNKSLCHFSLHCQANSDEEDMQSWSQGSRLGAWSELRQEVLQWGRFPASFKWRLKYAPHLPSLICLFAPAWPQLRAGDTCAPRRGDGWCHSTWLGARSCGLCANRYLVPDHVTVSRFLICEWCIIEEPGVIWCFLKEELLVFVVSSTNFLSSDCRQWKGAHGYTYSCITMQSSW